MHVKHKFDASYTAVENFDIMLILPSYKMQGAAITAQGCIDTAGRNSDLSVIDGTTGACNVHVSACGEHGYEKAGV